jgi:CRP-like cAMP-binding protein
VLFEAGGSIDATYFLTSAVISIVVTLSSGQVVEAAMVGRDGVVGASAALDGNMALSRAVIQLSGGAIMVCGLAGLRGAAMQSQPLLSLLIRHEQTLYAQAQQSAACMAAHHVDARLCGWLLRSRDLSQSDTLLFTQEFLAEMLGVTRTSVTVVAHTLQQAGIIKYTRGKIRITNLEGLQDAACECYEIVRSQYQGLLGEDHSVGGTRIPP